MFGSLGTTELIFILVIALIILGPRKAPQLARWLGDGLERFRRTTDDLKSSWEEAITIEERQPRTAPTSATSRSSEKQPSSESQIETTNESRKASASERKS